MKMPMWILWMLNWADTTLSARTLICRCWIRSCHGTSLVHFADGPHKHCFGVWPLLLYWCLVKVARSCFFFLRKGGWFLIFVQRLVSISCGRYRRWNCGSVIFRLVTGIIHRACCPVRLLITACSSCKHTFENKLPCFCNHMYCC